MNNAPVSIRMLLIPLKTAVATKARRQAPSAAESSEPAGCCCAGARAEFIKDCTPLLRTQNYARAAKRPAVSHPGSSRGIGPGTIMDRIYPHFTTFGQGHGR